MLLHRTDYVLLTVGQDWGVIPSVGSCTMRLGHRWLQPPVASGSREGRPPAVLAYFLISIISVSARRARLRGGREMPVIPSIELVSYVAWIFFTMIGLFTLQAFRNNIKWGKARYMGITMTAFAWMNFIYGLALFRDIYRFVSLILGWPNWIEISLFLVVLVLSLWLYFKLRHREKFKPKLFIALFLVPLCIPALPTAAKLAKPILALVLR